MAVVRGELGLDDIQRAGLAIAATDGLAAVSMRKVADAIGVWPTAVYHHVGDKDGLVQLVLDGVLAELAVPDPDLPWDEWLRAFAAAIRDVLRRYPGVASHLNEIGNSSRPALALMDGALGVLLRDGFGPEDAVVLFVDFFGFLLSRIRREETIAAFRQTGVDDVRDVLRTEEDRFRTLLSRGRRVLSRRESREPMTDEDYRYLHDTHGLPRELVDGLRSEPPGT